MSQQLQPRRIVTTPQALRRDTATIALGERPLPGGRISSIGRGVKSVGVIALAAALVGSLSLPAAALQADSYFETQDEIAAIAHQHAQEAIVTGNAEARSLARDDISGTTVAQFEEAREAERAAQEAREAEAAAASQTPAPDETTQQPRTVTAPPANGSIVQIAQSQLGVPYVWGGTSPQTGFDCSGFTMWVYAQAGYSLPRTSGQQAGAGTAIPAGSVAPGDLVAWPGHVAIYAGNNQILHSPTAGSTVKYSNYGAMLGAFGTPQVRRFG